VGVVCGGVVLVGVGWQGLWWFVVGWGGWCGGGYCGQTKYLFTPNLTCGQFDESQIGNFILLFTT
jgi:hypothetical protein